MLVESADLDRSLAGNWDIYGTPTSLSRFLPQPFFLSGQKKKYVRALPPPPPASGVD